MKQEIPKIFPPTPTSPKPQRPRQWPIRCVPRSRVHCLLVRSPPSPPAVHVPSRSVLISHMFWDEPSSHTHPTAGTEMITLGTMTVWLWRQLFSVSWFACRWRAPESVLSTVLHAALRARRSDSELTSSHPFWRAVSAVILHYQRLKLAPLKGEGAAVKEASMF